MSNLEDSSHHGVDNIGNDRAGTDVQEKVNNQEKEIEGSIEVNGEAERIRNLEQRIVELENDRDYFKNTANEFAASGVSIGKNKQNEIDKLAAECKELQESLSTANDLLAKKGFTRYYMEASKKKSDLEKSKRQIVQMGLEIKTLKEDKESLINQKNMERKAFEDEKKQWAEELAIERNRRLALECDAEDAALAEREIQALKNTLINIQQEIKQKENSSTCTIKSCANKETETEEDEAKKEECEEIDWMSLVEEVYQLENDLMRQEDKTEDERVENCRLRKVIKTETDVAHYQEQRRLKFEDKVTRQKLASRKRDGNKIGKENNKKAKIEQNQMRGYHSLLTHLQDAKYQNWRQNQESMETE